MLTQCNFWIKRFSRYMKREHVKANFQIFPGSKTCKNSETGKIEVNLLTA